MTIHTALHPSDDIDYMFQNGGRGFANIEYSVHASICELKYFFKKSKEWLITATHNNRDNIKTYRSITKTVKETEMGRKIAVWILNQQIWKNLAWKNLIMASKGKPYARNV